MSKVKKAVKQIKKMKIKGVSVKEVARKGFTISQKKRIAEARKKLR